LLFLLKLFGNFK